MGKVTPLRRETFIAPEDMAAVRKSGLYLAALLDGEERPPLGAAIPPAPSPVHSRAFRSLVIAVIPLLTVAAGLVIWRLFL